MVDLLGPATALAGRRVQSGLLVYPPCTATTQAGHRVPSGRLVDQPYTVSTQAG